MAQNNEALKLNDTIKENSKGQVILGTLEGICADFQSPTRNGRQYDESLWEKVFNNPIVEEYFESGGIPGELDHPTDRLETCSEKIAIMMPEKPKKDKDGHLVARFDILDTPNGRIAYTLAKYGYKLGISSRGNGDVFEDVNGNEHVNEDTYDFQGFDLVLLPAVKSARLRMVESVQNGKTFKQAINESLEKATPDEKRVMTETLNNLNIEYTSEKSIDKKEPEFAANNAGANVVKELQESLLTQQKLQATITELQEKLSVCYAKESKYEEDIAKYKSAIRNLSESASNAKALQNKVTSLNEELKQKDLQIKTNIENQHKILERKELDSNRQQRLSESLLKKTALLEKANNQIKELSLNIESLKENYNKEKESLQESLADMKKTLSIKSTEYSTKLDKANKLVEKYKNTTAKVINRYIESKSTLLGIDKNEIINKLPNNYSFDDIDTICEDISEVNLKVNSLPFNLSKISKAEVKESKEPILPSTGLDDNVDESLLKLANNI